MGWWFNDDPWWSPNFRANYLGISWHEAWCVHQLPDARLHLELPRAFRRPVPESATEVIGFPPCGCFCLSRGGPRHLWQHVIARHLEVGRSWQIWQHVHYTAVFAMFIATLFRQNKCWLVFRQRPPPEKVMFPSSPVILVPSWMRSAFNDPTNSISASRWSRKWYRAFQSSASLVSWKKGGGIQEVTKVTNVKPESVWILQDSQPMSPCPQTIRSIDDNFMNLMISFKTCDYCEPVFTCVYKIQR